MKSIVFTFCAFVVTLMLLDEVLCELDMDDDMAMSMLKKYNYMGPGHPDPAMSNDSMYSEALLMFQDYAGINMTGELDVPTMEMMKAKRCGLPDITNKGDMMRRRKKRYAINVYNSKWRDGKVNYYYDGVLPSKHEGLTKKLIEDLIDKAFKTWSDVANLKFTKLVHHKRSDTINMKFASGNHGDGTLLDGPGGDLAHAFPPKSVLAGQIHFDDEETWVNGNFDGTDFFYVALHEIGHSLGLVHSKVVDSIMYAYYPKNMDYTDVQLTQDDITGISLLYGSRDPESIQRMSLSEEAQTQVYKQQFCSNANVDAVATLKGLLFVFQGNLYAELDQNGIRPGFPRLAADDWPGIPSSPDAALTWGTDNILLIFKGEQYWRYYMGEDMMPKKTEGYPRQISTDFKGKLPQTIDAAFVYAHNGYTYIINGDDYYRIVNYKVTNSRIITGVKGRKYPKSFSKSWNVHTNISDVLSIANGTIFFSHTQYTRYDDKTYMPKKDYPKVTAGMWFGCNSGPSPLAIDDMELKLMAREEKFTDFPDADGAGVNRPVWGTLILLCAVLWMF